MAVARADAIVRARLSILVLLAATVASCASKRRESVDTLRLYSVNDLPRSVDPNGFLFNPAWFGSVEAFPDIEERCRFRVATRHLERRSLLTTVDGCLSSEERSLISLNEASPSLFLGAVCVTGGKTGNVKGHINWFPVTATGQLKWAGFSGGIMDHDLTMDLLTPVPNASTATNKPYRDHGNRRGYHIEFYQDETLGRMPDQGTSFWHVLNAALMDDDRAAELMNDRFTIVTGLYGVDGVHSFHAKLHPVYAMSTLVDVKADVDSVVERWAVMVRNQGSEGDCASGTHPLLTSPDQDPLQNFVIDLGGWDDTSIPSVTLGSSWSSHSSAPTPHYAIGADGRKHLYMVFRHPRPRVGETDYVFLGELLIRWPAGGIPWPARLSQWLPNGTHPALNLATPQVDSLSIALDVEKTRHSMHAAVIGSPGATVVQREADARQRTNELERLPSRSLTVLRDAPPVFSGVNVYKSLPWPLTDSVSGACNESSRGDPVCRTGYRWAVATSYARRAGISPVITLYRFPHASSNVPEGRLGKLWSYLAVLGYRLDLRYEEFAPVTRSGSLVTYGPAVNGPSLRVSTFISPNNVRFTEHALLMPYTIANVGASILDGDLGFTAGWGLGLQAQINGFDALIEAQKMNRGGHEGHWAFTAALLLPFTR